jgi:cell division septation protein DedD
MATTTDDGFREIQLDGKQLIFLFMAGTVVLVVIFLLGVLVGRNVRAEVAVSDPLAPSVRTAEVTGAPPPPPAISNSGAPSATANEPLSYPQRLGPGAQPRESLGTAPPRTEPAPTTPAASPAPAAAPPTTAAPPAAPAATEPKGAGYAIQLTALAKRDEADAIARRLSGKGYAAYVVSPEAGAPAVFRVRVGKFKERREAEGVAAKLEKEEQFKPWIVR